MVAISIEMLIAIPVVITLAIIVSLTIVNISSSLAVPPVANIHTELINETQLGFDFNNNGVVGDVFWLVSGSIYLRGTSPNLTIKPNATILFKDLLGDVLRFAAIVPYNVSAIVITTPAGQVVVGVG